MSDQKPTPREFVEMLRHAAQQEGQPFDDTQILRALFEITVRQSQGAMFDARIVGRNDDGTVDLQLNLDSPTGRMSWLAQLVHEGGLRPTEPILLRSVPVRVPGGAKKIAALAFDDGDITRPYAELSWVHNDEMPEAIADGRVDVSVENGRLIIHIGGRQRKLEEEPAHHLLLQSALASGVSVIAAGFNRTLRPTESVLLASDRLEGPIVGQVVGEVGSPILVTVLSRSDSIAAVKPHDPEIATALETEPPPECAWAVLFADSRFLLCPLKLQISGDRVGSA